jgi:metal-dependent amidase/aminoacylase/carboxypeptidase family protein
MDTSTMKGPPRRGSASGPKDVCLAANDADSAPNSVPDQAEILRNPRAVREARRQLNLEFLHECAGGIAVHASLVQTFAEIGDPAGACYALKRLFAHVNAVHAVYAELCDEAREATP